MAHAPTNNHFISVSRRGELMARRKGQPPVHVATSTEGLIVATDEPAQASGVPPTLRIGFEHGGGNRTLCVTTIATPDGASLDVDAFLERHAISEQALAQWIRRAIEDVLDRAATASPP
jgi:hypothetical protein